MLDRVLDFAAALRRYGVPVSIGESIDALTSLRHVSLADKAAARAALRATMLKDEAHHSQFEILFELFFGAGPAPPDTTDTPPDASPTDFEEELAGALGGTGSSTIEDLARSAVAAFGRVDNPTTGPWYSNYEVTRSLNLSGILQRLEAEIEAEGGEEWAKQVRRSELRARVERFRSAVLAETRRRTAEMRGPQAVAAYAVPPVPEELSFLSATAELHDLRRAVHPLARKLASRIALKRKHSRRGSVDVRRSIRRSLSSGGVPFDVVHRKRVPHRPELFVLCDVSSSVARFSRFSLMLTHALKSQFSGVRSFAFIDRIDEVTRFFEHEDFAAAVNQMNREAEVVWFDGHSDYGSCFEDFAGRFGRDVRAKTTLLVLGDARNNYRARKTDALSAVTHRARHSYWLNPEPQRDWDTGDSAASEYAACVDAMVEVRNLRQLQRFIEEIL